MTDSEHLDRIKRALILSPNNPIKASKSPILWPFSEDFFQHELRRRLLANPSGAHPQSK